MSDSILDRIRGWSCPSPDSNRDPYTRRILALTLDASGYEQGERINGIVQCPGCRLHWPIIEDVTGWTRADDGRWLASEWGPGAAECVECRRVFVDTFEGVLELELGK